MGGRYQNTYDSPCTAAIDGTALPYDPHPGNGWVLITLPTVAMVTNLYVVLCSTDGGSGNLHLRVLANDNEDEGVCCAHKKKSHSWEWKLMIQWLIYYRVFGKFVGAKILGKCPGCLLPDYGRLRSTHPWHVPGGIYHWGACVALR